jgi:hypothetical protein
MKETKNYIKTNWFTLAIFCFWIIDSFYNYKNNALQNEQIEQLQHALKETKCIIEQEATAHLLVNRQ